jgi:hypothetical protein
MTDEDVDVKKPRTAKGDTRGSEGDRYTIDRELRGLLRVPRSSRRTMLATSELFRGMSLASADAFRAFSEAVETSGSGDDMSRGVARGVADGNTRYIEGIAAAWRHFVDAFLEEEERMERATAEIDYERLAKLVAAELKASTPTD